MNNKRISSGRAVSTPAGLLFGAGVSLAVTLFGTMILAWMVDNEKMQWEKIGYGIMVVILMASFWGSLLSFQKIKRQRLMVCLLSGAAYLAVLLSLTALFFGGQYQAVGVTSALILAGSGAAGLLGVRPQRRRSHTKIGLNLLRRTSPQTHGLRAVRFLPEVCVRMSQPIAPGGR